MKKFDIKKHVLEYELNDLKFPVKDDFGDGFKFTNVEGRELVGYVSKRNGRRKVTLEITSYRGSIAAVHYYGRFVDSSLCFTYADEDVDKRYSIGGYGLKGIPKGYDDRSISLYRPVTKKDLMHDKRMGIDKLTKLKLGALTTGFWEEEDVIALGKKLFPLLFQGQWRLQIRSYTGDLDEEILL
jgi:hypothetical protein